MNEYFRPLRNWNYVVIFVHLASFFWLSLLLITNYDDARRVRLWTDFGGKHVQQRGSYRIAFTLIPFPLITAFFHMLAVANTDNYYFNVLRRGVNSLRWVEYSITNGLMSWSLAVIAGAGNVFYPIVAVLCNFFMQYMGYLHEFHNHGVDRPKRSMRYWIVGFLPWLANWLVVFGYYAHNGEQNWVDSLAIGGSFLFSFCFAAALAWRYTVETSVANNYYMELAFIILSLTAKLWLDWVITIGNLA